MRVMTLGSTGITVPQNAFEALPVQRVSMDEAVKILRRAYEGGMRLLYAMSGRYHDQSVCPHVPDAAACSKRRLVIGEHAGRDEKDRELSGMRCMHQKMSL